MNVLRNMLLLATAALLFNLILISKPIGDSWILHSVLFTYLAFVVVLVFFATSRRGIYASLGIAASLALLSTLPSIKYYTLYNPFDTTAHVGVAETIVQTGYVPTSGYYSGQYGPTPLIHILLSSVFEVTCIAPSISVALLLGLVTICEFLTILVSAKHVYPFEDNAIYLSCLLVFPVFVWFVGTTYALVFYTLIVYFLLNFERNHVKNTMLFLVIIVALILTHFVTAVLSLILAVMIVAWIFRTRALTQKEKILSLLIPVVIFVAWIAFLGQYYISLAIQLISLERHLVIPEGFVQLAFWQQIQYLIFANLRLIIPTILLFAGIPRLLLYRKTDTRHLFPRVIFIILAPLLLVLMIEGLIIQNYARVAFYILAVAPLAQTPLFAALLRSKKIVAINHRHRISLGRLLLIIVATISLLTLYGLQPLYPQNHSFPVQSDVLVNSEYQLASVGYLANHYGGGIIAADPVTSTQLAGFQPILYSESYVISIPQTGSYQTDQGYCQVIAFQRGGASGPLTALQRIAAEALLRMYPEVYDNGQSFIALC
jgi:hypothetical protein